MTNATQADVDKAAKAARTQKPQPADEGYEARRLASRNALKEKLPEGMSFFEAPDGFVLVGESGRSSIPHRLPDGSRILVNPRRTE